MACKALSLPTSDSALVIYRRPIYDISVIKTFRCKDTQALFEGRCPRRWKAIQSQAERKLMQLEVAADLRDLRAPPGNRFGVVAGRPRWTVEHPDQ